MLHEYDEIDPLILSVSEDEEVTIKHVAESIVKAMDFKGSFSVSHLTAFHPSAYLHS